MKSIWRIFQYCIRRIILLAIENRILKIQIKALIEGNNKKKH